MPRDAPKGGVLTLGVWLVACARQDAGGECIGEVHDGELITLETFDVDLEDVCSDSLRAAEQHVQWVADAWGSPAQTIHYHLFNDQDSACWPCAPVAAACAQIGNLSTTQIPDLHEIAHSARGEVCSSAILEEGWAMRYGGPGLISPTHGALRDMIEAEAMAGPLPGHYYAAAARVTAVLEGQYGIDVVRELCPRHLESTDEWDDALQATIGLSLDEFEAELNEQGTHFLGQYRRERACEDGSDTPLVAPVAWSFRLDCDAEGVVGRRDTKTWDQRLVRIETAGRYSIHFASTSNVELTTEVESCDRAGPISLHYAVFRGMPGEDLTTEIGLGDLAAGTYVVRLIHEGPNVPGLQLTANLQRL